MFDQDGIVERRVREELHLPDLPQHLYDKHLRTALAIATTAYTHTHIDVQVHITSYTLMTTSIDDFDLPGEATEQFVLRFVSGQPQLSPSLEALADNLRRMYDFYLPHAASTIIASTLEFISATLLEKDTEDMSMVEGAEQFAIYTRSKSGVAAAYGLFIWDKLTFPNIYTYIQALPCVLARVSFTFSRAHVIPQGCDGVRELYQVRPINSDTRLYSPTLCTTSDILSFYKEELEGDDQNVVHTRALASRREPSAVLASIVDEVIDSMGRCEILLPAKELQAWEGFLSGYLTFHYLAPRYRLDEILIL